MKKTGYEKSRDTVPLIGSFLKPCRGFVFLVVTSVDENYVDFNGGRAFDTAVRSLFWPDRKDNSRPPG